MRLSLETLRLLADAGDWTAASVYCSCISRGVIARTARVFPGCPVVSALPVKPTLTGLPAAAPRAPVQTRGY